MNRFLADFVPILIAFPMVLPVWMISYFALNQPFALSVVISLAGGVPRILAKFRIFFLTIPQKT